MATKRALIVDDSKTAQHRLKRLLQAYDLDIVTVDSAESALSYLSSSVPNVVFMDHLMPGMDGFRALQIIKSHPATATIPVIMYTSKSGDVYTSQARALGALDVVSKDTINASDLKQVLKAIHIYRKDAEDGSGSEVSDNSGRAPVDTQPSNSRSQAVATQQEPARTIPAEAQPERDETLSLELRIRELEHTIDDNRRIITSRLVREVQGVRHEVRKLQPDLLEIRHRVDARASEADSESELLVSPEQSRPGFGVAAALSAVFVLGLIGWWQINGSLDAVAERQAQLNESVRASTEQLAQSVAREASRSAGTNSGLARASSGAASGSTGGGAGHYLPDLSWALNESSIQDFHQDVVAPELAQRLQELLARLGSRDFEGRLQVNVRAGDFCVVTNMSGESQLPMTGAQMESCALMSELHGTDATTVMVERLQSVLAEAAFTHGSNIEVEVRPLEQEFREYPTMSSSTSADHWNQMARLNNRVLVNLEPAQPRTAQQ